MRLKIKIAANTLVQILGKLISAGCTFLITVLIARRFGVEGFGEFVKITTYVSLFYLIVDFGLNAVVLREYQKLKIKYKNSKIENLSSKRHAEFSSASDLILKWFDFAHHPEPVEGQVQNDSRIINPKIIFLNLLGLRIAFALVLIFVALAILVFLPFNPLTFEGFTPLSKLGIIILAPTILTQAIFTSCNAVFQKNLRYDLSVLASSSGSLVGLGLVYLLIKLKTPLLSMVASYLVGGAIMAVVAFYFSGYKLQVTSYKLNLWRRLFFKSLPLGLTLLFNLIYFKADTLILTVFRSTKEVGVYGLAKSFFEFPLSVPTFFMNAVYPILLTRTREHKNTRSKRLIKKSAIFLVVPSLLLTVSCYFLAPYITLIKKDFAPSVTVFRILSLFLPIFFLSSLFMWTLIAFGRQKVLLLIYGQVMIISILLNLFFIPRYGVLAAVAILGISELMVLGLTGIFFRDLLKEEQQR